DKTRPGTDPPPLGGRENPHNTMKNNGLFFVLSTYCHSDSKPALFNAGFVYVVKAVWCRRVVVGLFP
ncbi:hypothetical protein, partial [Salmonella enterica]|uniref:hypothetical protein n=1 Tax=Salmonella enterica TaxID=28901 RepID=UPI000EFAA18D